MLVHVTCTTTFKCENSVQTHMYMDMDCRETSLMLASEHQYSYTCRDNLIPISVPDHLLHKVAITPQNGFLLYNFVCSTELAEHGGSATSGSILVYLICVYGIRVIRYLLSIVEEVEQDQKQRVFQLMVCKILLHVHVHICYVDMYVNIIHCHTIL